jgi:hypothetical protein
MVTVLSLAFKVTDGGATTAGVVGLGLLAGGVLLAGPLLAVAVSALELIPHAASEPSAASASMDFNANANLELRLRRIELITRLPRSATTTFFRGVRFLSSAIFEITYWFDISNPPTCRHLRTTYV